MGGGHLLGGGDSARSSPARLGAARVQDLVATFTYLHRDFNLPRCPDPLDLPPLPSPPQVCTPSLPCPAMRLGPPPHGWFNAEVGGNGPEACYVSTVCRLGRSKRLGSVRRRCSVGTRSTSGTATPRCDSTSYDTVCACTVGTKATGKKFDSKTKFFQIPSIFSP